MITSILAFRTFKMDGELVRSISLRSISLRVSLNNLRNLSKGAKMKRQKNPQFPAKSLACKQGDIVIGMRVLGDNYVTGIFIDHYYTLNNGFSNYASRIRRLRDNKVVSFQFVRKINPDEVEEYNTLNAKYKAKVKKLIAEQKSTLTTQKGARHDERILRST
jgi:hypothetical protein